MSDIKRVYSQPNASSLKEGEEVVYLSRSKPLARYRKEGGQVWVSYMTTNGDLFVEKDFNVQGTISQGGSGGGSGPPIVKGGLIEQTAGGVGVSTAGTSGGVSFASGTPSVGTLPIDKGGTAVTANTTWVNSNVVMTSTGALGYDGNGSTVTMNTLTDANNIRSRVTSGLDSSGDMQRVVGTEYGGTGQDFSNDTTGFIKIHNGTASQLDANDTKNDLELDAVLNVVQNRNFAETSAPNATAAGDTWVDTNDNNKTYVSTGTGTGNWTERTVSATAIASGTLPTAQHSAHVTDNLNANGLVSGRNLGDGLEAIIVWSDAAVAGGSAGDAAVASTIWQETSTSAIVKITFNYLHDDETKTVKVIANALCSSGQTATMTAGLHDMSAGVLSAQASGSAKVSDTGTTTSATFTRVVATLDVTSSFTEGVLYKGQISLHTSDAARPAKMTGAVVVAYGS